MTDILAPCPGRVLALAEVPDPVFAGEMVGPGIAIDPVPGPTTVVSPIAGKIVKLHPHAFVVVGDGVGVLVHLGINTVRLEGVGFEVLSEEGADVEAGTPIVTWDPSTVRGDGLSTLVPVVIMDAPKGSVSSDLVGSVAATGDLLFST